MIPLITRSLGYWQTWNVFMCFFPQFAVYCSDKTTEKHSNHIIQETSKKPRDSLDVQSMACNELLLHGEKLLQSMIDAWQTIATISHHGPLLFIIIHHEVLSHHPLLTNHVLSSISHSYPFFQASLILLSTISFFTIINHYLAAINHSNPSL